MGEMRNAYKIMAGKPEGKVIRGTYLGMGGKILLE
jgi:hypothetical protein